MRDILKQLLELPAPRLEEGEWADYSSLDFEPSESFFIQLQEAIIDSTVLESLDEDDIDAVRIHAWRMLVATDGLPQFDFLLLCLESCEHYDDFSFLDDFSTLCVYLGEGVIPLLFERLHNRRPVSLLEGSLVEALETFAKKGRQRNEIIAGLTDELDRGLQTHLCNAHIVSTLIKLKAVNSIETIRKAYAADLVNQSLSGSLYDVESDLGVLDESSVKPDFDMFESMAKYHYLERLGYFEKPAEDADAHERADYMLRLYGDESTYEGVSGMEGVIAASLAMEELVRLGELLAVIWSDSPDGELPIWQNEDDEGVFLDLVIEIQKNVSTQLSQRRYAPTGIMRDPDAGPPQSEEEEIQAFSFTSWAFGLIRGFSQFLSEKKQKKSPWREFIDGANRLLVFELKEELVTRPEDHPIMDVLIDLLDLRSAAQTGGLDALASVVRKPTPPVQAEKIPGRNDPCPCESGKKYKKCCGL